MGKLMKAAVLGGIADAFNGFATAKAQREQQQILFDRQDQQAKEEKEFRAEQAKLQRQARGFFLPGEEEEESAYDRMQAKKLQRKFVTKLMRNVVSNGVSHKIANSLHCESA